MGTTAPPLPFAIIGKQKTGEGGGTGGARDLEGVSVCGACTGKLFRHLIYPCFWGVHSTPFLARPRLQWLHMGHPGARGGAARTTSRFLADFKYSKNM